MTLHVAAPLPGQLVPLAAVPDEVFAAELVGPGVAIDPGSVSSVTARAPVTGRIQKLHPHAFVLVSDDHHGVLVHLGIDTVQLAGQGFTLHMAEGDEVRVGWPITTFSPRTIADGGRSPLCLIVTLGATAGQVLVTASGVVEAGAPLLDWE